MNANNRASVSEDRSEPFFDEVKRGLLVVDSLDPDAGKISIRYHGSDPIELVVQGEVITVLLQNCKWVFVARRSRGKAIYVDVYCRMDNRGARYLVQRCSRCSTAHAQLVGTWFRARSIRLCQTCRKPE